MKNDQEIENRRLTFNQFSIIEKKQKLIKI